MAKAEPIKAPRRQQPKPAAPAPPFPTPARGADYRLFAGLLLVGLTFAAYLPALWGGFIWDDELMLANSQVIKSSKGLYYIWCTTTLPDFFPLTSTSLWLEWRLWGLHPLGYHFTNILLHACSVVLVWRALTRLSVPGAWLAAAIFAVHPVNVESVAWIAERKNTLTMFFYALSVLFFLRWYQASAPAATDRRGVPAPEPRPVPPSSILHPPSSFCYGAALLFFLLALLSKTAVAPLPVVLLLCAWWLRKRVVWRDLLAVAPFFGLALVLGLVTVWFQYQRAIGPDIVQAAGFVGRLATAGCAVWFYLGKVLVPVDLAFVYPRWEIDPHSPVVYLPGLALVGCFSVFWFYRKSWGRAGLFGLGYFVLMLLPILGFLNIYFQAYSLVADHWQYFAMIGAIALFVAAAKKALPATGDAWLGGMLGLAAVGTLSLLTWRQAQLYTNAEIIWRDTLAKNPACWLAHCNLGVILRNQGKLSEAEAHYRTALQYRPKFDVVLNNLGALLIDTGRAEEAIDYLRRATASKLDDADAHNNLGIALAQRGRLDEALVHFRETIRCKPDNAIAHNSLANILVLQHHYREAVPDYQEAIRLDPTYAEAHNNLGFALAELGQLDEAVAQYREALRLDWHYALAHFNLGCALARLGQGREAAARFREALQIQPDYPAAREQLQKLGLSQ
jgi:protein O-mannosyl-transferase